MKFGYVVVGLLAMAVVVSCKPKFCTTPDDCPSSKEACCGGVCQKPVCSKNKHCEMPKGKPSKWKLPGIPTEFEAPWDACKQFECEVHPEDLCLNTCVEVADCDQTLMQACIVQGDDTYACMEVDCFEDEDCNSHNDCIGSECTNGGYLGAMCTPDGVSSASPCSSSPGYELQNGKCCGENCIECCNNSDECPLDNICMAGHSGVGCFDVFCQNSDSPKSGFCVPSM
mmetsp:Transcript_13450/g.38237  ORF Transcript_13450/g.38237 Transcript_13450/m.38237 type:complete len:227 (+) Transcript_13450:120-800(+)|eukprot:CAMPEP_0119133006 /NCGR_PEP_ID=MMETSP1310-20130426/12774_1 /TAXON_ID=464262 /ORGANISM="Genus nov. species nov., Strain RCC2339" /LENGTH=226 /DNA_ID=CAMNT_0007123675 /DNA_START=94 /DNA_END=774 /DNA_ORIENTATION=+